MTDGLSVIIITTNRCNELKKTLELLKQQVTNFEWEVLICDQNSNDNTESMVKDVMKSDTPYALNYLKLDKNYGVAGGRNIAIKNAKYNNVFSLDDDANPISNNTFQRVYELAMSHNYNAYSFRIFNNQDKDYGWQYNKKNNASDVFECNYYVGCAHLLKKDIFEKCGGYDDELMFWGEEVCYILKMFCLGYGPVLYDGTILFRHRVDGFGRGFNEDRFFYQVRNRLYLVEKYYPTKKRWYYSVVYRAKYLVKAISHNWISTYFRALSEKKNLNFTTEIKLSEEALKEYLHFS